MVCFSERFESGSMLLTTMLRMSLSIGDAMLEM